MARPSKLKTRQDMIDHAEELLNSGELEPNEKIQTLKVIMELRGFKGHRAPEDWAKKSEKDLEHAAGELIRGLIGPHAEVEFGRIWKADTPAGPPGDSQEPERANPAPAGA